VAANYDRDKVVEVLVQAGADVSAADVKVRHLGLIPTVVSLRCTVTVNDV
jgi:signal transduction protein with GAF and PtsI domain